MLGLGDLVIKDIERRQPQAGRLDVLLSDSETLTRYEVEIQLGATDEAHIIRRIEYWDIEKTRYPQYEHVAVLVAEDITSRFLNVIRLFHKAIPLIAIQLRALDVGGILTISGTTVAMREAGQVPRGRREVSRRRPAAASLGAACSSLCVRAWRAARASASRWAWLRSSAARAVAR